MVGDVAALGDAGAVSDTPIVGDAAAFGDTAAALGDPVVPFADLAPIGDTVANGTRRPLRPLMTWRL